MSHYYCKHFSVLVNLSFFFFFSFFFSPAACSQGQAISERTSEMNDDRPVNRVAVQWMVAIANG
eukprot:m.194682 g.194682  ORF g.194682 m.194682 type:complete len:64 (+) comp16795_c5_seq9:964-1155(+)